MRLGLQQGAAVGHEAAQHGAVALQQLVGELDHAGVRPAVLAHAEQLQEGGFLLRRRMLGHQDGGGRGRARDAGVAMDQDVALRVGVHLLAERQHLLDMGRRAGLEAGILGHDIVEADQLVIDAAVAVEGARARLVCVDDRQHMGDADRAMLRQFRDAADGDFVVEQGHGGRSYSKPRAMCRPSASMP